jgi:peroxiredoxin
LAASQIYLYGQDGSFDYVDTIPVRNGKFNIQIHVDTLSAAYLNINNAEYPIYFKKGDHIRIQGDALRLYTLEVSGNGNNDDFADFKKQLKKKGLLEQLDFTGGDMSANQIRPEAETFIANHGSSLVSLYLLDKYLVHQPTPNYPHIKELIHNLSSSLRNTSRIVQLNDFIIRWEKSRMGAVAPGFSLPDERGAMISRNSEELKDKYVLLAFWASWASNRAQSAAEMRQLYNTFGRNPKFAMVGVSLDVDKGEWTRSVKQDSLKGMQLCDLNGFSSPITNQYTVTSMPAYYLIAPDGVILARDMIGDALKRQIAAALK